MWGSFLMSGVIILHSFQKDWWKFIQIHQYYTMALSPSLSPLRTFCNYQFYCHKKLCWLLVILLFILPDSTVLAYVMKLLNERYDYGLKLVLLSVDEGITGYRDDSLEVISPLLSNWSVHIHMFTAWEGTEPLHYLGKLVLLSWWKQYRVYEANFWSVQFLWGRERTIWLCLCKLYEAA